MHCHLAVSKNKAIQKDGYSFPTKTKQTEEALWKTFLKSSVSQQTWIRSLKIAVVLEMCVLLFPWASTKITSLTAIAQTCSRDPLKKKKGKKLVAIFPPAFSAFCTLNSLNNLPVQSYSYRVCLNSQSWHCWVIICCTEILARAVNIQRCLTCTDHICHISLKVFCKSWFSQEHITCFISSSISVAAYNMFNYVHRLSIGLQLLEVVDWSSYWQLNSCVYFCWYFVWPNCFDLFNKEKAILFLVQIKTELGVRWLAA